MCLCCREEEGRGKRRVTGERQTFEMVVGEVETLAKFLIERGGERTDQRGRCVCVCLGCRGTAEEGEVLQVRHLWIVVGEVDTLVKFCRARERLGTLKIQLPQQETVIRGTRGTGVCL